MRIANRSGRPALLSATKAVDVMRASAGRFGGDRQDLWSEWTDFQAWASDIDIDAHDLAQPYSVAELDAPVPRPRQVFAIGLNYADHAAETKLDVPENPVVFTKFPSALTGPQASVRLSGDRVDWEAELVVVIGTGGRDIPLERGWDAVAGLTVGQDLSDRTVQSWGRPAQFNLGKSFGQYAPIGPAVVTLDEVRAGADPDALRIRCELTDTPTGESRVMQDGTTANMLFPVPQLIARLSAIVELFPGDLVFTGTPAGVGLGRDPQEFLRPGQVLTTEIEGLGSIRQTFTA